MKKEKLMGRPSDVDRAQQKIAGVFAAMLVIPVEVVKGDVRYKDHLKSDPDAIHTFGGRVERALGVTLNDAVLSQCPTIAGLAAYCVRQKSAENGGRLYVVVCQMQDGSTLERYYRARGHELAAQQALDDDGVVDVLSVERADADDGSPRRAGWLGKVMFPLIMGAIAAAGVVAVIWWRRGCPRFW